MGNWREKSKFLQLGALSPVSFPSGTVKCVLGRAKQVGGGREFGGGVCVCARFLYIPGGGSTYAIYDIVPAKKKTTQTYIDLTESWCTS